MTEFDFSGDLVNELNTAENDILTIVSIPISEIKESPTEKVYNVETRSLVPKKYKEHKCDVDLGNNTIKVYKIDNLTGIRFKQSFGKDVENWISKKFTVKHKPYTAFGKGKVRIEGYPLEA
jgi:hypothetical protein